ncbi:hypothetical protein NLJ89_g7713 [Agrocybe chaxingu]|uniref:Metallo-beta-lactamase domain-containing protein n=1 Tax=Agrocybe chaxingu TaxID=84603 RepID=A0A9W8JU23_9AGAR|nr:hypothetical protein NLJ89_g7713 [Agrocybe chaxingu]
MHSSEVAGSDIRASPDGLWRAITQGRGRMSEIVVDAGPILHRDPCLGYVFSEVRYPSRKIVILGDTYDPSPIIPLCNNPSPSLLIHEATDSHISHHADPTGKLSRRTERDVLEKALSRGHSVPEMAGAFAKLIGARDLVLNHIGGRFPAPRNPRDAPRQKIMRDIENNAARAWGSGRRVTAAYDYMRVHVPFDVGNASSSPETTLGDQDTVQLDISISTQVSASVEEAEGSQDAAEGRASFASAAMITDLTVTSGGHHPDARAGPSRYSVRGNHKRHRR